MKSILFACALLASAHVSAGERARFDLSELNAGYDVQREENTVTGEAWGLAGGLGQGKVELKKEGKVWSGRIGMVQVTIETSTTPKGAEYVSVRTLPGGFHDYYVKANKKGNYALNGRNARGEMVTGEIHGEGKSFGLGNDLLSTEVRLQDSGLLAGTTVVYNPFGGFDRTVYTRLGGERSLRGQILAKEDAGLFVLLYVLPLNLNR